MNDQSGHANRYAAFPDHPLANVPQSTLDVARSAFANVDAEMTKLIVDADMVDFVADAVVAQLAEAGLLRAASPPHGVGSVLDRIPPGLRVAADLAVDGTNSPRGILSVPHGTPDATVAELRGEFEPEIEVVVEEKQLIGRFAQLVEKLR